MIRCAAAILGALLAGGIAAAQTQSPATTPDSFYVSLLHDGELLADQGKSAQAAKSLRIACFGMLDQPAMLARCLVRLGLAQSASGDAGGFRETFSRLLELESRAPSYAGADLAPPIRSAFEQQVAQRIPGTTLAASPAFHKLAGTNSEGKEPKSGRKEPPPAVKAPPVPAPPPAATPVPVTPPAAKATPAATPTPPTAGQRPTGSSSPTPAPAPAAAPPPAPTTAPGGLSADDRTALGTARTRMQEAKVAADLLAAADMARKVADAHPASIEANALAGEIFYRGSRWPAAVLYLKRSGPPANQPVLAFYLAVAQFESGDRASAAATLRPVLGKLAHTPYVQSYVQKILPP